MAKRIPPKVTGADACPTCNGYGSPAPLRMICPDCGGSGARQAPVPDADVPAMLDQIATLRADLAASQREAEQRRVVLVDVINDRDLKQSEVGQCRELLSEMVANACTAGGILDSMGLAANADALRYLASIGRVEIVSEQGRRVVARWTK